MNNDEREAKWLLEEKYDGTPSDAYKKDLELLKAGTPLAYLIGHIPFLGCHIDLSLHPLIPRTETEYWVEKAIEKIRENYKNAPIRILDVFAGSGCIGIALLSRLPNASVDFAEIDETLVEQIKKNLDLNDIDPSRYRIFASDVFASLPEGTYDAIVANPPYINPVHEGRVEESVLEHEPHKALFAAEEGFALVKKTIEEAPKHLRPGGTLYLEHDDIQKDAIESLAGSVGAEASFYKDQFDKYRWVTLLHP